MQATALLPGVLKAIDSELVWLSQAALQAKYRLQMDFASISRLVQSYGLNV